MKYLHTYENYDKELTDLESEINNCFDGVNKGNKEKKNNLYALITILKDINIESYNKYKKEYNDLK